MQHQTAAIECVGLGHTYSPGTPFAKAALSNITLNVGAGEFVGLIGHTGSGKSTLIQHFNALLQPTEGTIRIHGADIHADKATLRATRQNVGLVFQYPEHQLFEVSVYKDVSFGPENMGLGRDEVDARVRKALALVGIGADSFEKSPFELSGGQKRRVAIAGVLAMQPSVLILDEPTAGLDPRGRTTILSTIKNMHDELGITVVLVSHSMEDIAKYVSKIIVMHSGTIFKQGTREEVFADAKALENIGLDAPVVSRLFQELRAKGLDIPGTPFTTHEATQLLHQFLKN
ncbi:MAG: energy-coupling factor transporter ATPase [Defluviitaleaceae bacterium]|nr:energy-coupling factor transporter ATPase [Defluviitaleaceae bacterium]